MIDAPKFKVECFYGEVEIVKTYRQDGRRLYIGSYSIWRDDNGKEIKRTETTEYGYLDFGEPPKPSLWCRFNEWFWSGSWLL